jgi:amylosucrase
LRAVCRIACPAVAFKAEAIVAPSQLVAYLGTGRRAGKVSDLAYNNVLMVQVWSMLAEHDVRLAAHTLGALPEIPAGTAWVTYVRGHDDIGWAVDDADAAAVGLAGAAHRAFLADYYAGIFPGSSAAGLVFQHNLATGDRRISGGTGTLAGLQRAVHDGDRAAVDAAVDRILLAYAIVFGWGGIPVVWMGDELGLLDDPTWAADPAHAGDNRWSHRPRFDLDAAARRHDPRTVPGRIFAGMARLSACRAAMPALHARGERHVLPVADHGVLGVVRRVPGHQVLQLYNVAAEPRPWPVDAARAAGTDSFVDAISEQPVDVAGDQLWLPAYAAAWFGRDL